VKFKITVIKHPYGNFDDPRYAKAMSARRITIIFPNSSNKWEAIWWSGRSKQPTWAKIIKPRGKAGAGVFEISESELKSLFKSLWISKAKCSVEPISTREKRKFYKISF